MTTRITARVAMVVAAAAWPAHAEALGSPSASATASTLCMVGYTYSGDNGHTYAITAGQCATLDGEPVRDQRSGATATFITSIVDPPHSGGADSGLVDFNTRTLPLRFIGNHPFAANDHPRPRPGQIACRNGITTGKQCGTVAAPYDDHQYLTTGMPPSRGGDSGGPVWTMRPDGHAQVVGNWLGGRKTRCADDDGRCASLALASGMDTVGIGSSNINR